MRGVAISPARLAAAYTLDLMAGDPEWFPHPVRVVGAAISAGERCLRRSGDSATGEIIKGSLLTGTIVAGSWCAARSLLHGANRLTGVGHGLVESLLAWTTLATRSLLLEAGTVLDALEVGELNLARLRLSRIVGRDTESLDHAGIARAVIETVAESACDGIVAPLAWLALGGAPAGFAYKAVNTLDSMIGHREPPYRHFGCVAARLDDVANFVPARVTALLIVTAAFVMNYDAHSAWRIWQRDGGKHASPNAGQCEAAMAGALGVQLGGVNTYDGTPVRCPRMGAEGRIATGSDARRALRVVAIASGLAFGAALLISAWRVSGTGDTRR